MGSVDFRYVVPPNGKKAVKPFFSDNFTRANGALGDSWMNCYTANTQLTFWNPTQYLANAAIASNTLLFQNSANAGSATNQLLFPVMDFGSQIYGLAQFARVRISAVGNSIGAGPAVMCSQQNAAGFPQAYQALILPGSPNVVQLERIDSSARHVFTAAWGTTAWALGDLIELSVVPSPAANVLTYTLNGVVVATFTDNTGSRYGATGVPALALAATAVAGVNGQMAVTLFECGAGS